jgi:hypothetical protein
MSGPTPAFQGGVQYVHTGILPWRSFGLPQLWALPALVFSPCGAGLEPMARAVALGERTCQRSGGVCKNLPVSLLAVHL